VDLDTIKDLSIVVGGVIAFLTLWVGLFQYAKQSHSTRASQFIQMRRRFLEDETFRELLNQISACTESVQTAPIQDRRNLVGFLEEVALMVNSRLIRKDVAHYMFGHYVLLIDNCDAFWEGLDRQSEYWSLFRRLAEDMRSVKQVARDDRAIRI
jgi:hypothetical protein